MAEILRCNGNIYDYLDIASHLVTNGSKVESRVGNTIELEDVTIRVVSPRHVMPVIRPKYHKTFGLLEAAQLVGGFSDAPAMVAVLPRFRDFSDFWGAYGPRVNTAGVNQVENVISILKNDPFSRRAVISLWDAEKDALGGHTDHPCTIAITFRVRRGYLNMTVHMRSNDIWRGWAYDCVQFAELQITIADFIGARVGIYTHHADSFHAYERDIPAITKMLDSEDVGSHEIESLVGFKGRHTSYKSMADELRTNIVTVREASYRSSNDAVKLLWGLRKAFGTNAVEEELT